MYKQEGFSLMELLISILILSLFLLGFDALQVVALRQAIAVYYFSVATEQVKGMVNRLNSLKNQPFHEALATWNKENSEVLPQGMGTVKGTYPHFKVTIKWGDTQSCDNNRIGQSGCLHVTLV